MPNVYHTQYVQYYTLLRLTSPKNLCSYMQPVVLKKRYLLLTENKINTLLYFNEKYIKTQVKCKSRCWNSH